MKTLRLQISDEIAMKIEQAARERGVSVEELVRSSVEKTLARDEEFETAAEHVLTKNAELYKRLS